MKHSAATYQRAGKVTDQVLKQGACAFRYASTAARLVTRMGSDGAIRLTGTSLRRVATEADYAVARRIDRLRLTLLVHERIDALADRLQTQADTLEALSSQVPADATGVLAAQKGQIAWLLGELRRPI